MSVANEVKTFEVGEKVKVKVIPVSEIFFKEDSGFGIYSVETMDEILYVMKGTFPGPLTLGNTYEVEGEVILFRGELQISAKKVVFAKAEGRRSIIYYLQTLKGLKSRAELIYDTFGENTLNIVTNHPEIVASRIRGIGKVTTMKWATQLKEKAHEEELMLFLFGLGLTPNQVDALNKVYPGHVREVLEDNPYRLIQDVRGYGFKKCDAIARSAGIEFDDQKRIRAGVYYTLQKSTFDGNTYLPESEIAKRVQEMLCTSQQEMAMSVVKEAIEELIREEELVQVDEKIFLSYFDYWEHTITEETKRLALSNPWSKTTSKDVDDMLTDYLNATGLSLEKKQTKAVLQFSSRQGGFYILNGSAGCGKTFTLKVILSILQQVYQQNGMDYKLKLMAPTGKASKVASKATGLECMTVHRGLEFAPEGGFMRNEDNRLEETVIVVDESSMLDTELAKDLLLAVGNGAKVIFLGDTKQLPSVGAGNVLKDLIASGVVDVVTLDVVKRQGAESGIINNANQIIAGKMVVTQPTNDSFVLLRNDDASILKATLQSYRRLLEKGMSQDEIQVLTPQRKGKLGIYNLNRLMQEEFNPDGKRSTIKNVHVPFGEPELFFRVGDKVINIQNDIERTLYKKEGATFTELRESGITNGECGRITDIQSLTKYDKDAGKMVSFERVIVKFEDCYVFYDSKSDIEMLDHAYALTIHKSQGSQWRAVIQPISSGHVRMLDNNLIYTGLTRASEFHCFIAIERTLSIGIGTFRVNDRFTGLLEKLIA